jgi:hypothetical protein
MYTLKQLIHASNHSADGTSGESFRYQVTGAGTGIKMTDYKVTGLTYVSGAPSSPSSYTYTSPYTFTVVFTLVRNSSAYNIQTALDSAGTYLQPQDSTLYSGTRTYSQVVSWDYQTTTNNTVTITIDATVTGVIDSSYIPGTGGGQYNINPVYADSPPHPNSIAILGSYGSHTLSTDPIIVKFRAGFNDSGDVVPLLTQYFDNTTEVGTGVGASFDGDAVGETPSGYTDSPVGLMWALSNIDAGGFNPIVFTSSYPFRQQNVSGIYDPTFKWYSDSSFTTLVATGAEFSPGSTSPGGSFPGPYYVKNDNGKYYGYPGTPQPTAWADPRPAI